jgi:hypothetical protein
MMGIVKYYNCNENVLTFVLGSLSLTLRREIKNVHLHMHELLRRIQRERERCDEKIYEMHSKKGTISSA